MWLSASKTGMSSVACGINVLLELSGKGREELPRPLQRGDPFFPTVTDRYDPDRQIRRAGVGERPHAFLDRRLAARGEEVADLPRISLLQEPLVVRRRLGLGEDAVRAGDRGID